MNKVNDFLDGLISYWHLSDRIDIPLSSFLGFSDEEYNTWLRGEGFPLHIKEKIENVIKEINMENDKLKNEIEIYVAHNCVTAATSEGLTEYITSCINTLIENKTLIPNTDSMSEDDKIYAREMRREFLNRFLPNESIERLIPKVDFLVKYVMEGK